MTTKAKGINRRDFLKYSSVAGVAVLLGACTQQKAPAPPAAGATPASAPAQPGQVFTLKFQSGFSRGVDWSENTVEHLYKPLEAASKGRLKFQYYYMPELVEQKEMRDAVSKGALDVIDYATIWDSGSIPATAIHWGPALYPGFAARGDAWWQVHRPFLDKIYQERFKIKMVGGNGFQQTGHLETIKPVRKMEDIKGMRIRAPGGMPSKFIEALGASAVSMTPAEARVALEQGAIDGVGFSLSDLWEYGQYKTTPYAIMQPLWYCSCEMLMNLDTWNKLPADLQQLIMDYSQMATYREGTILAPARQKQIEAKAQSMMKEVYTLPADEWTRWLGKGKEAGDWFSAQNPQNAEVMKLTRDWLSLDVASPKRP